METLLSKTKIICLYFSVLFLLLGSLSSCNVEEACEETGDPEICSQVGEPDSPGQGEGDDPISEPEPDPIPEPTPDPTPTPAPEPDPEPDPDPVSSLDWQKVADFMVAHVDPQFRMNELNSFRSEESFSKGDDCHASLQDENRFADSISFFVNELFTAQKVQLQGIASFYGMQSSDANYFPVSLMSHNLCRVTRTGLSNTVRNIPSSTAIALSDRFAVDHNRYRSLALSGDDQAKGDLQKLWGSFFGCLAYTESLSTADTSLSSRTASRYAPSGYRKPAGVKFYDDPAQNEASRLNIGLFQFTPTYTGNINPCIRQWNRDYPSCSIARGNRGQMIPVMGSSLQRFNAYCGVHKLLQTFSVQVNSSKTRNSHPDNRSGSSLKPSGQRCVTPHFYAGWAYNHFGPLQNSTGSNLLKLMKCVYPE